ncbi:carbon-nitrogen hydrolase [Mariniblastus sp.]|nr:carbon-nitrogen hydrolase [Mariniblastus sp.]
MPKNQNISNKSVSVAAIQLPCSSDIASNIEATVHQIEAAAKAGANLICLQELFSSLYFCQSEDHAQFEIAESIPGPTIDRICKVAYEQQVVVVAGMFERRTAGVFHNSAVVIEADGSILGTYRKMHIPDDPYFYEKFYFTPGDLGFKSFQTSVGNVGVCICWDQWFPEAARLTAMQGAEILVYPTAIGWQAPEKEQFGAAQVDAWRTMMRSHAIANGVYVVAPNRVGVEGNIEFWGSSFVADPYGCVIAKAGLEAETIQIDCDLSLIETARTHWPFFRDRRIDAFAGLTDRWGGN